MNYLVGNEVPERLGTAHPNLVPYQVFACQDGYLMVAIGNDRQFQSFCQWLGLPHIGTDKRFATNAARVSNRNTLVDILAAELIQHGVAHWLESLAASGVPAGPIQNVGDVLTDAFAEERNFVRSLARTDGTPVPTVSNPVHFSDTPVDYRRAPPALGEHTDDVLAEALGLDAEAIARLRQDGVI